MATEIAIDGPGDQIWGNHLWHDRPLAAKRTISGSHTWSGGPSVHRSKNCCEWSRGPSMARDHLQHDSPPILPLHGIFHPLPGCQGEGARIGKGEQCSSSSLQNIVRDSDLSAD